MKSQLLLHCTCASPVAVDPAEADQAAAGAGADRGPAPGDQVTNGSAAPGHVTPSSPLIGCAGASPSAATSPSSSGTSRISTPPPPPSVGP